jgi:hypothetical protein
VNKNPLGWILLTSSVCVALAGCATPPKVISLGDDTYSVTRVAKTGFTTHTAGLKEEALDDASKFCASQGKQLKVVAVTEEKPPFMLLAIAKAKVVFKALDAGDPQLRNESTSTPVIERPVSVAMTERPAAVGDLYADLLKLDELRKKGILTEEEFQSEKKKVLDRSK